MEHRHRHRFAPDSAAPLFRNRAEAGRALARALAGRLAPDTLVLALPRGGVPVAVPIAAAQSLPLDLCLVRKIGLPDDPELAVGAVAGPRGESVGINTRVAARAGLGKADIEALAIPVRAELARRRELYLGGRRPAAVHGRPVAIIDDGAATGATMLAAIGALRGEGAARIIAALPVAAPEALEAIAAAADVAVCLSSPPRFRSVGEFYADFSQLRDDEVRALLSEAALA